MNEPQLLHEIKELHKRCDSQAVAINTLTSAVSEHILIVRAYENIINQSWWLTRWLSRKKVIREMIRVDELEGKLREQHIRLQEAALRFHQQKAEKVAEEAARDQTTEKRRQELKRLMRKHNRGTGK